MPKKLSLDIGEARRNGITALLKHLEMPSLGLHGEVPPSASRRAGGAPKLGTGGSLITKLLWKSSLRKGNNHKMNCVVLQQKLV